MKVAEDGGEAHGVDLGASRGRWGARSRYNGDGVLESVPVEVDVLTYWPYY